MTKRMQACGRAINDLERFTCNGLLNAFHVHDTLFTKGASTFQETMGKKGRARRLTTLDRYYIPFNIGQDICHA